MIAILLDFLFFSSPLYERVLKSRELMLGPNHPMVAATLRQMGVSFTRYILVQAEPGA